MVEVATAIPEGLILPPPEIRSIVDKTAAFVAKSPKPEIFEDKIRTREKSDSRFAFLNVEDAYHAYYQHRLQAFRAGEVAIVKVDEKIASETTGENGAEDDSRPIEPPALEFLVDHPGINAVDLDILRLTALFTARSGRRFTSELAKRENRNYQFDFLRPSHSLFGYFNRLTEQYTKVLIPSQEVQSRLELRSGGSEGDSVTRLSRGRQAVLKDAKERVEWERWESSRREEMESAQEAERIAFAEIDWQDFIVVSTVEFTESDKEGLVELPPPMSISEVENMTIAQKKMAAMIMEGREEELEEIERERTRGEELEMEIDDAEEGEAGEEAKLEKERQRVIEIRTADSNGPMKIRKDYVFKAKGPATAGPALTTFGNQQVPVEDFAEHLRIELLDPKWKEAKRQNEANRSAANLLPGGTDVSASIRALAAHRPDIFGSGTGGDEEEARLQEAAAKSKAREKDVWDGHTASKESATNRYQAGANLDEQIEALMRSKGLIGVEDGQTPRIGPAIPTTETVVPVEPSSFVSGATFSAAPQPNQSSLPYSYSQNYNQAGVVSSYSTQAYAPGSSSSLPIAGLPARPMVSSLGSTLSATPVAPITMSARAAEDGPEGEPDAKRQRVPRRDDGSYWPEEEWISSHPDPISIRVQLPTYPEKVAWGCNGTEIILESIPLTLLVGTIRDRITSKIGIPISKQKLSFNGRILANSGTLAGLNFEDGDLITLDIKDVKKK